ncbi:conjugal transfer protein TraF [Yoonia sp. SS1-5]|uniref:Conjugal transfer protein TraF n=1 Tax=Yoonia rhodophyticola TaxID=3137370 RepID=A0AAN0M6Z7_9RHOB
MKKMSRRSMMLGLPASLLLPARRAKAAGNQLGLIFVAQSTCPYCQSIAPVLKQLSDAGVADVMLASMDRRPVPPFVRFQDGHAHPLTAHFRSVPQVLVYNANLDQVTHVVGGVRNPRRYILRLSHALQQSAAM